MLTFLVIIIVVTVGGVLLLASMFHRDDTRLGTAALAVLISADVLAMVYAALDQ